MREQVVTPRAGRGGAASKVRAGGAAQQRTPPRRARASAAPSRSKGVDWKKVLGYAPLAAKLVLAVTVGILVFAGYRAAAAATFFQVKEVDVEGTSHASREEIKAAVMQAASAGGVWRADLDTISREVGELPWVRTAVVSRVLPSGLRVRVTEREPRLIARTSKGRLVWVDDDGVALGAATPNDNDFLIRGLDENLTEAARHANRERMALALELKSDWERSQLSKRVSEADLSDLHDVRVHLAGEAAGIQVVLGAQDYTNRFRQALEKLDEKGRVQNGESVSYVNMTTGRNAIFGFPPEKRPGGGSDGDSAGGSRPAGAGDSAGVPTGTPSATRAVAASAGAGHKKDAPRKEKGRVKKDAALGKAGAAVRPRRVG